MTKQALIPMDPVARSWNCRSTNYVWMIISLCLKWHSGLGDTLAECQQRHCTPGSVWWIEARSWVPPPAPRRRSEWWWRERAKAAENILGKRKGGWRLRPISGPYWKASLKNVCASISTSPALSPLREANLNAVGSLKVFKVRGHIRALHSSYSEKMYVNVWSYGDKCSMWKEESGLTESKGSFRAHLQVQIFALYFAYLKGIWETSSTTVHSAGNTYLHYSILDLSQSRFHPCFTWSERKLHLCYVTFSRCQQCQHTIIRKGEKQKLRVSVHYKCQKITSLMIVVAAWRLKTFV